MDGKEDGRQDWVPFQIEKGIMTWLNGNDRQTN